MRIPPFLYTKRLILPKCDRINKIKGIKAGVRAVDRKDFICWQYRKNGVHRKCPSGRAARYYFFLFCFKQLFPGIVRPEMRLRITAQCCRIRSIKFMRDFGSCICWFKSDFSFFILGLIHFGRLEDVVSVALNRMFLFMRP